MMDMQRWWLRTISWGLIAHVTHASSALDECPAPRSLPMQFPERSCIMCPEAPQLQTLPHEQDHRMTSIWMRNDMVDEIAELRFVDVSGDEHIVGSLEPGRRTGFHAAEGHVTRAYSAKDGRLLVEHMAGRRPLGSDSAIDMARVAAHPDNDMLPKQSEFRETPANGTQPPEYPNFGFVNTLSVPVQLFFRGLGKEHQIYELGVGETYFEATGSYHEWVARTRDGQLVTEFTAADVVITRCSPALAEAHPTAEKARLSSAVGAPVTDRTCSLNGTGAVVSTKRAIERSYSMA
eukprot:TRINITY_DN29664_c0_g1_i1.p1 TRINITY_DN29664_c0_g1~~TRINITY_DN29664_c0_g1_i1.p1  ORF type:complete len:292 (+),score=52.09 TRINITY_DN29664_c0_g1_i1:59-934(+)